MAELSVRLALLAGGSAIFGIEIEVLGLDEMELRNK